MERTSAACAMEWSIDLEKGLRSKKPGQSHGAILRIGQELENWDREPAINKAQYNMFGLIPGEDRLFANAILLRLTDAFSSGDKQTKLCVVKVFLSLLRKHKKSSGKHCGILFKCTPENRLELLRRVKTVFDSGDAESRALALVLFGCWNEMAKDNADIRYLILSSLVSCDVLQVTSSFGCNFKQLSCITSAWRMGLSGTQIKVLLQDVFSVVIGNIAKHIGNMEASLFAGSCFCELSDDFACVLLEILVNLVTSCETLSTVRFAGARAFAKMGCSPSQASKAYKAGLKLVLDSSEEEFLVVMLISLSKLAVKSARLISGQASLLLSYLTQEKPLHLQVTALKCLHYILVKGMGHFPASSDSITTLVSMLDESEFPPALQCGALQIFRKVLLYNLPTTHGFDILEFSVILTILENATLSSVMAKRLLAIRVIVDILGTLMGRKEKVLDGVDSTTLASWLISFLIDKIGVLIKLVLDLHQLDSEMELEGQSLLGLLLLLVEKYPDLGAMVLDKICLLVEYIASNYNQAMGSSEPDFSGHEVIEVRRQKIPIECIVSNDNQAVGTSEPDLSGHEIEEVRGQNSKVITSKLLLFIPKIVVSCLENLNDAGTVTTQVRDTAKTLVKLLQGCSLFDCFTYTIYIFILYCHISYCCMFKEIEENDNLDKKLSISLEDYLGQRELLTVECAKNMIERKEYWCAYKVGKYAACQGTWVTAAFIFKHLATVVQSNSCDQWLKSLSDFAHSERNVQLLNLPDNIEINLPDNIEILIEACNCLRSSEETMSAMVTSGHALCFQRWFLSLRSSFLESVADMLRLYHVPFTPDNLDNNGQVEGTIIVEGLRFSQEVTSVLLEISSRLNLLARKFDLIATSFRGMDKRSLEIISAHALFCSLLAFSTGFSLFFPKFNNENILEKSEEYLHGVLIQDLVFRLQQVDCEASAKLGSLWSVYRKPKSTFLQSRSHMLNVSYEARCLLTVCSYAVTGVVALQSEANNAHNDQILHQVTKYSLQLLLDIIRKSMFIPFQMPNYFFRVRPCILSELFALNSDTRSQEGIAVSPGFLLSLDLCLQLKNIPPGLQLTKLYCILYCRMSFQVPYPEANRGQMQLDYRDWGTDDMIYLNDKLLRYVTEDTSKFSNTRLRHGAGDSGAVDVCVCFEPNEKGQGFSTCLVDVSAFPLGRYRIKWHSCFVDSKGSYWSLLPSNAGPVFTVQENLHKD